MGGGKGRSGTGSPLPNPEGGGGECFGGGVARGEEGCEGRSREVKTVVSYFPRGSKLPEGTRHNLSTLTRVRTRHARSSREGTSRPAQRFRRKFSLTFNAPGATPRESRSSRKVRDITLNARPQPATAVRTRVSRKGRARPQGARAAGPPVSGTGGPKARKVPRTRPASSGGQLTKRTERDARRA